MGDESISFFKMNFNQKVQVATQRLQAQGKEITTANIVKEMVSMAKVEKANGDAPVQGYAIEHTNRTAAASRGEDIVSNVYGVPNIPNINMPQNIMKFLDFIMELLPQLENLPPEFKDDLIEVLTEYVTKLEEPESQIGPREVYGTPDIILDDEKAKKLTELFKVMNDMGIDKDVMNQIAQKFVEFQEGSLKAEEFDVELDNIIANAGLSEEQASKIKDFFLSFDTIEMVYGTPEKIDPNSPDAQNIQKLIDFANKLQDMNLPSDLISDILQELANAIKNEETGSYIEVLDKITARIKEANLPDEQQAELMNAVSELLNEINNDVATSICLYGSPNIPSFKGVLEKFLPDITSLSEEWRGTLANLVKTIIAYISKDSASGIEETKNEENNQQTTRPMVKTLASGRKIIVVPRYDNNGNLVDYVDLGGRAYSKDAFRE